MRFGCCTSIDNYKLLEKVGYDFIELSGRQIASMTDEQFEAVRKTIEEGKIYCNGFNDYCPPEIVIAGPKYDLQSAKEYASKICRRGAALKVKTIGIGAPMSRVLPDTFDKKTADMQAMEFLKATADIASKYDICILWESLNKNVCNYVLYLSEAVEMVEKINHPYLKIVLDFYHMAIMGEDVENIGYAIPYVKHLHVAQDIKGQRGFLVKDNYNEYKTWLESAKKFGYDGTVSVEPLYGDINKHAEESLMILKNIDRGCSSI